jgi:hypothetical protein
VGNYGKLWEIVGNCGKLWEIVGNCGKLWEIVGNCGKLWEIVGNCGKLWEIVGFCGKLWVLLNSDVGLSDIWILVLELHLVGPKSKFPTIQYPSFRRTRNCGKFWEIMGNYWILLDIVGYCVWDIVVCVLELY